MLTLWCTFLASYYFENICLQELWELVTFAEDFFARADEDGSNEIEWEEFRDTIAKEPLLLEVFNRCMPTPLNLTFHQRNDIRDLAARAKLTW